MSSGDQFHSNIQEIFSSRVRDILGDSEEEKGEAGCQLAQQLDKLIDGKDPVEAMLALGRNFERAYDEYQQELAKRKKETCKRALSKLTLEERDTLKNWWNWDLALFSLSILD